MKKNNSSKFRKVVSVVGIISIINFLCFQNSSVTVAAKYISKGYNIRTNGRNLRDKFKKNSALCKKLIYDKEKETGVICPSKEEMLNEMGIFDNQIENMSKETIDNIENHEIVEANNMYYQVDEDGDLKEITVNEIDEVISEKYKNEIKKIDTDSDSNYINNLWNKKAKAATKAYDYSKKNVNSGVLQQGVMVTTTGEKGVLRVWYQATWISSPHCRGIDICGVCTSFGTPIISSIDTEYYYNYIVEDISPRGGVVKHDEKSVIPSRYYKSNGVIVSQNLYSQWKKITTSNIYPFKMTLKEYIRIEYDLSIPSSRYRDLNMVLADYWHKKDSTTYQINPSFSSDGTISLGLTTSQNSTYTHITPNLAENFSYTSGSK